MGIFLEWELWFSKFVVVTDILHFSYVPAETNAAGLGTTLCNVSVKHTSNIMLFQQYLLQYAFLKIWAFFFLQKHASAYLKIDNNSLASSNSSPQSCFPNYFDNLFLYLICTNPAWQLIAQFILPLEFCLICNSLSIFLFF